jgi:hypothetical protein
VSISPNPQAGGPPLVGCRLFNILSATLHICKPLFLAQPGDKGPVITVSSKALRGTLAAPVAFASTCCSTLHQQQRLSMLCQNRKLTSIYELITSKLPCAHRSELTLTAHPMSVFRKCVGLVDCSRMTFRKFRARTFDIIDLY